MKKENFAGNGNEQTFTINDRNGNPMNVVVGQRGESRNGQRIRIQVEPTSGRGHVGKTNGNGNNGTIKGVAVINNVLFIYGFAFQENRPTIWTPNLEKLIGQGIIGMTQFNLKKGIDIPNLCD